MSVSVLSKASDKQSAASQENRGQGGIVEDYLHATADRMMESLKGEFAEDEFSLVDNFLRNYLLLPADRDGRDRALVRLRDMLKYVPVKGLHATMCDSVEMTELARSLDAGMRRILDENDITEITHENLSQALVIENRLADRTRLVELLQSNIIYYKKYSTMPPFLTKALTFALDKIKAPALSRHIEALLHLAGNVSRSDEYITAIIEKEIKFYRELSVKRVA